MQPERYEVTPTFQPVGFELTDQRLGYQMIVDIERNDLNGLPHITFRHGDTKTTARTLQEYVGLVDQHVLEPDTSILELGAGLGAWIPHVLNQQILNRPPTVVDLVDYEALRNMLEFGLTITSESGFREQVETLIGRCNAYLQETDHIHAPYAHAITQLEQRGPFDLIVDLYGVAYYERSQPVAQELQERVLAEGGSLLVQPQFKQ